MFASMLKRTPPFDAQLAALREAMTIPTKGPDLLAARACLAAREAVMARHKARELVAAKMSRNLPIDQQRKVQAELDEADARVREATDVELAANTERNRLQAAYTVDANAAIADGVEKFGRALVEKLDELQRLMEVGTAADASARAVGVKVPEVIRGSQAIMKLASPLRVLAETWGRR